jgi:cation:H+ antiporter
MDWMIVLMLVGGLVTLIIGAEVLVRGASKLAAALGISPLVIGLTVVAFGTSSPELAVSIQSAFSGNADVAVGNVVGSNIFNILLILGLSAVITPLIVHQQLVRFDVPIMIGLSLLILVLALDGNLGRFDGLLLFAGMIAYTAYGIWESRKEPKDVQDEYSEEYAEKPGTPHNLMQTLKNLAFIVVGLALLVVGSDWLVNGAVALARLFNISDLVIGLTIIAAGTSMPEVATSVMAAIKKERDIAVGNVVGSNIFNILSVLGLSSLVAPSGLAVAEGALRFDIPVMIGVALITFPIFFTGKEISRWEGTLFLGAYVAYTAYLLMNATGHELLGQYSTVLLFIVPLIFIMLFLFAAHEKWFARKAN